MDGDTRNLVTGILVIGNDDRGIDDRSVFLGPDEDDVVAKNKTDATGWPTGSGRTRSVMETMDGPASESKSLITW